MAHSDFRRAARRAASRQASAEGPLTSSAHPGRSSQRAEKVLVHPAHGRALFIIERQYETRHGCKMVAKTCLMISVSAFLFIKRVTLTTQDGNLIYSSLHRPIMYMALSSIDHPAYIVIPLRLRGEGGREKDPTPTEIIYRFCVLAREQRQVPLDVMVASFYQQRRHSVPCLQGWRFPPDARSPAPTMLSPAPTVLWLFIGGGATYGRYRWRPRLTPPADPGRPPPGALYRTGSTTRRQGASSGLAEIRAARGR